MKAALRLLITSTPMAILLGSLLISLAILTSGGVIKFKNKNTANVGVQNVPPSQAQNQAIPQPTTPSNVTISLGHFPVKGGSSAKVAIVEYADFRCPFCEKFYTQTLPQILNDYVDSGKAKLTFRHFQFLGPASTTAGNAAECAHEQGKFWEYHDYLFKNQPSESDTSMYTTDKLTQIAESLGLNSNQFKTCLDSTKFAKNVSDDQADGSKVGITGTPSFIVGKLDAGGTKIVEGKLIVGAQPYSSFKTTLDEFISK